jgi:hypothetical protein
MFLGDDFVNRKQYYNYESIYFDMKNHEVHDPEAAPAPALTGPVLPDAIGPSAHRALDEQAQLGPRGRPTRSVLGLRRQEPIALIVREPEDAAVSGAATNSSSPGPPRWSVNRSSS